QDGGSFNVNIHDPCTGFLPVEFNQIQLHIIGAIGYGNFVGEITVAFALEYGTAASYGIAGGIGLAASEVTVGPVIHIVKCRTLRGTDIDSSYDVVGIGRYVAGRGGSDQAGFTVVLCTPA